MENDFEVKSYFAEERQKFLSRYQNSTNTNIIAQQQVKKTSNMSGGGSTTPFGRDIPIEDDRMTK